MKLPNLFPASLFTASAIAALFAPTSLHAEATWTGATSNDWNTGGNWTSGQSPDFNTGYIISQDGATVTMSGPSAAGSVTVSGNGTTAPELIISQNLVMNWQSMVVGSSGSGSGYSGVVRHISGTVGPQYADNLNLNIAAFAGGDSSGNTGAYYFGGASAGTAPVFSSGLSGTVAIGGRPGETGLLSLSGHGTFTSAGAIMAGVFNGSGTIRVEGGNLSINAGALRLNQSNGGSARLDAVMTESGFSTINVSGEVYLGSGVVFNLSLGETFTATLGQSFAVIDAGGGFTGLGVFSNVAEGAVISVGNYDFQASYLGDAFTLTAIAVPEPGVSALLALAGGLVVLTARSRRARRCAVSSGR